MKTLNINTVRGIAVPNCSITSGVTAKMYLHNKYTSWYNQIITNAKNRHKFDGYFEKHHIIPKSLGGDNSHSNLVLLTAKEHFICHLLLPKMVTGKDRRSMTYALWTMINQKNKYQSRVTGRMYEYCKKNMQKFLSEERKGKSLEERYGKERADEIRQQFKKRKTRNKLTEQEKKEISDRVKLAHQKNPWKRNFQNGQPPKVVCETCQVSVTPANYSKYHKGDKCTKFHRYGKCLTCSTEFRITNDRKKFCSSKCANSRFKKSQQINATAC